MPVDENLATIRRIYDAFSVGDVPTIIDAVSYSVDWATDAEPVAPWYGVRRGRDGVLSFFGDVDRSVDVLEFGVEAMGASEHEVFAFLRFGFRSKATGREATYHLHHYFRFDGQGKIEYYRGSEDSALVAQTLAD